MWESAISGMGNAHNCAPKLQAYPPIFSLTPKASGSTRFQSCEVHKVARILRESEQTIRGWVDEKIDIKVE